MTKEPMIEKENRPTAIDYDMPITQFKLRDLLAVIHANLSESFKPEHFKPEHFKPEQFKPEQFKEYLKPERFKENYKPEKEMLKPEKEGMKPDPWEKELIENISTRIIEKLQEHGVIKK
jgi:hypothetical protein